MSGFIEYSRQILPVMLQAWVLTMELAVVAAVFGTLLGLVTAFARMSKSPVLNNIAGLYVTLFRGTPLLLQVLFFYGALPQFGLTLDPFPTASIAFSLNAGAYIAEIIRAAIQSIDKGQMEAARSLGMSYNQAMRRIILPQTFRRLLPPMVNELAALTKDTSLAMAATLQELMKTSQHFVSATFKVWQTYFWTALLYLIVTVALSKWSDTMEKKLEARG